MVRMMNLSNSKFSLYCKGILCQKLFQFQWYELGLCSNIVKCLPIQHANPSFIILAFKHAVYLGFSKRLEVKQKV